MMEYDVKDVVLGDDRFQIARMNASAGSWLLFKLFESLRKIMSSDNGSNLQTEPVELDEKQRENATVAMVQGMLMTLDRATFDEVQREALKVCGQYTAIGERETVLPVLMSNGNFAIPSLKNDIMKVVTLTSQSLVFNLSPFFVGNGLAEMFQLQ